MDSEQYEYVEEIAELFMALENNFQVMNNMESLIDSISINGIDAGTEALFGNTLLTVGVTLDSNNVEGTLESFKEILSKAATAATDLIRKIISRYYKFTENIAMSYDKNNQRFSVEYTRLSKGFHPRWKDEDKEFTGKGFPNAKDLIRLDKNNAMLLKIDNILFFPESVSSADLRLITGKYLYNVVDKLNEAINSSVKFVCTGRSAKTSMKTFLENGRISALYRVSVESDKKALKRTIKDMNDIDLELMNGALDRELYLFVLRELVRVKSKSALMYLKQLNFAIRVLKNIEVK